MTLIKVNSNHWIWGENHIKYCTDFGNSGWFWDKNNEGPTFGCKTYRTFLEVLDVILGDEFNAPLLPKPAGLIQRGNGK